MGLEEIIMAICPVPEASMRRLTACASRLERPQGHHVLQSGKVERNLFFIEKGIARAYVVREDKEITFWIGKEGNAIVSLKSYVKGEPGYENIELMEDSVLHCLRQEDLCKLFEEDVHIANWGRKFAELEFLQTEEKLIPLLFTTASYRYELLLKQNPDLLQRLPLECLASYLGITPVSLSRIRAKLR